MIVASVVTWKRLLQQQRRKGRCADLSARNEKLQWPKQGAVRGLAGEISRGCCNQATKALQATASAHITFFVCTMIEWHDCTFCS